MCVYGVDYERLPGTFKREVPSEPTVADLNRLADASAPNDWSPELKEEEE